MGSQCTEILRQGIWASLTGGWYYDPHQSIFTNTFHLYLWLYLLSTPFCFYLYASWSWIGWTFYIILLGTVALIIKIGNYYLHHLFDNGECLQKEVVSGPSNLNPFQPASISTQNPSSSYNNGRANSYEAVEMQVVKETQALDSPPAEMSSKESLVGASGAATALNASPRRVPSVIDLKVDVHHKDSSTSEEGGYFLPKQIAEVKCLKESTTTNVSMKDSSCGKKRNETNSTPEVKIKAEFKMDSQRSSQSDLCEKDGNQMEESPRNYWKASQSSGQKDDLYYDPSQCSSSRHYTGATPRRHRKDGRQMRPKRRPQKTSRNDQLKNKQKNQQFPTDSNLNIVSADRSCSAPNCSVELTDSGKEDLTDPLKHRRSFCNDLQRYPESSFDSNTLQRRREKHVKKGKLKKLKKEEMDWKKEETVEKEYKKSKWNKTDKSNASDTELDYEGDNYGKEENQLPGSSSSSSSNLLKPSNSPKLQNTGRSVTGKSPKSQKTKSPSQDSAMSKKILSTRNTAHNLDHHHLQKSPPRDLRTLEQEHLQSPYQPLVFRRSTSLARDAMKVTTLTFENVISSEGNESRYANNRSLSSSLPLSSGESNQSEEDFGACQSYFPETKCMTVVASKAENNVTGTSSSVVSVQSELFHTSTQELTQCSSRHVQSTAAAVSEVHPLETGLRNLPAVKHASSVPSDDSSPGIEWLFCHSDSDSGEKLRGGSASPLEMSLESIGNSLPFPSSVSDASCSPTSCVAISKIVTSGSSANSGVPASNLPASEFSGSSNSRISPQPLTSTTRGATGTLLRDPDGHSRHGAIPKRRRQGVIVGDSVPVDSLANEEGKENSFEVDSSDVSGVTMDLVRKMLDVFSSYPESRQRDIKKFMVLVSLEQQQDRQAACSSFQNNPNVSRGDLSSKGDTCATISDDEFPSSAMGREGIEDNCKSSHEEVKQMRDQGEKDRKSLEEKSSFLVHHEKGFRKGRRSQGISSNDLPHRKSRLMSTSGHREPMKTGYDESSEEDSFENESSISLHKERKSSSSHPKSGKCSNSRLSRSLHSTTGHDDPTSGAVHCFQDEKGNWFTYTIDNLALEEPNGKFTPRSDECFQDSLSVSCEASLKGHSRGTKNLEEESVSCLSSMSLSSGMTVVLDTQGAARACANSSPAARYSENAVSKDVSPVTKASSVHTQRGEFLSVSSSAHPLQETASTTRFRRERGLSLSGSSLVALRSSNTLMGDSYNIASSNTVLRDFMSSSGSPHVNLNFGSPSNPLQLLTSVIFERRRLADRFQAPSNTGASPTLHDLFFDPNRANSYELNNVSHLETDGARQSVDHYYKLKLFGKKSFIINFDRLSLLALLDRNLTFLESFLSAFLVVLVGVLSSFVLFKEFYHELYSFLFCLVVASCQYSLFKSVQPDASSPTHGYNPVVLYSRPVYFCLCSILILSLDFCFKNGGLEPHWTFSLYGFDLTSSNIFIRIRDFLLTFILFFPLLFSFGLLPQVNTFFMYILEQLDIHLFGGNGTTSLSSAFYCVIRSFSTVLFLTGLAFGGLREESGSQHPLYSIFCALTVVLGYHLSRSTSNPTVLWQLILKHLLPEEVRVVLTPKEASNEEAIDPLPKKLRRTVIDRLAHDLIVCSVVAVLVFAVHSSSVFTALLISEDGSFPEFLIGVRVFACFLGFITHYLVPQLRTQQPWMCLSRPVCLSHEYSNFEVYKEAKIMWFERVSVWLLLFEKNVVFPVLFLSSLTMDAVSIMQRHPIAGPFIIATCGLKGLRCSFSQPQYQYLVLAFTVLFFGWDSHGVSESFLVDHFCMLIIFSKVSEFVLKMKFIVTYIAPWQITWGSAFHAFAQPFSVPHSAMLFVQAAISSLLSTPLSPVLGSAIFITSYVRPVKFWERDYNTKRIDQTNTRLSSLLDQSPGVDDNNLNSIFYEHLTRSLQHSLCGDIILGRWGLVNQGDCFVLASDNLNCLVHLVEVGNGVVTFQVRGLEFRGTYCQQREVEAISEGVEKDSGCCCCQPGHFPGMLSANASFNLRWLAWEVTATKYVLEGYSISDNSAVSMLQMFELRRILITYYVKCIIFYVVQSDKLEEWLSNEDIVAALSPLKERRFADLDPTFNWKIDEDYDSMESGITRNSFCDSYLSWIRFCVRIRSGSGCSQSAPQTESAQPSQTTGIKTPKQEIKSNFSVGINTSKDSNLVSLCLALSLLGRRALGPSSQSDNVEVFLQFLHSLFKGDIRPTSVRDEWVFTDMELLKKVVSPALRISLKLHQDHFLVTDEYDNPEALYAAIREHQEHLVICHERDSEWRAAVLAGRPALLSLRHVIGDGEDKFKIIMLNKRFLAFRVIKVNSECVRGLWAGQQQELVFLRNRNPERGSIQNAKQALRNIINSSCDQPIGYPIYVSPLTTSYGDTNDQLSSVSGRALTPRSIRDALVNLWTRIKIRCVEGCSSGGSSGLNDDRNRGVHGSGLPESFPANAQLQQVLSTVPHSGQVSQLDSSGRGSLGGYSLGTSGASGRPCCGGSLPATCSGLSSGAVSTWVSPQHKRTSGTEVVGSELPLLEMNAPPNASTTPASSSLIFKGTKISNSGVSSNSQNETASWITTSCRDVVSLSRHHPTLSHHLSSSSSLDFGGRERREFYFREVDGKPVRRSPSKAGKETEVTKVTKDKDRSSESSSSLMKPGRSTHSRSHSSPGGGGGRVSLSLPEGVSPPSRHSRSFLWSHRHLSDDQTRSERRGKSPSVTTPSHRVKIVDANYVYDTLNLGRKIDVLWPEEWMRTLGGRNAWGNWVPVEGMEGVVVHAWRPHHPDPKLRSHVDRTIYLVQIEDFFVPVAKTAVRELNTE